MKVKADGASLLLFYDANAELATAVLLVVESVLVEQLVATILQASLAPVLCPEGGAGNGRLGAQTRLGDLLQALPTGRGKRGGEICQPQFFGLQGCCLQPIREALEATTAPLGLSLQASHSLKPALMVIVAVNPLKSQALCMPFAFLLADVIFLARKDVGIEIKDSGADVVLQHPLHDGRRTRSTTGMQQHLLHTCRHYNLILSLAHF